MIYNSKSKFNLLITLSYLYRRQRALVFSRELREVETPDILDRALVKAENARFAGVLPAPEFHRIREKVESLKKLRFVEEYENH